MIISRKLVVQNKSGFHLRVASLICKKVLNQNNSGKPFDGQVYLINGAYRADCTSCLDLLALMAPMGTQLVLEVEGNDDKQTEEMADSISQMFDNKFGEDECAEL